MQGRTSILNTPKSRQCEAQQQTYDTSNPLLESKQLKKRTRLRGNAYCRWREMSETYRQQPFGQPTFTDEHASGNSSGADLFDILDAPDIYHEQGSQARAQPLQLLHIPSRDAYAQSERFAYALHSSGVSVPSKQCTPPSISFSSLSSI